MKLPFLPIHIDNFVRSSETVFTGRDAGRHAIYFLSHAHTDHMTGLTPYWDGGLIFCTDITREILIQKMEDEERQGGGVGGCRARHGPRSVSFADRCVALPMWERIPLLSSPNTAVPPLPPPTATADPSSQEAPPTVYSIGSSTDDEEQPTPSVFVTLVPAFHIPGSVMLYFETPYGRLLYTGDFKYEAATAAPILDEFFRFRPVDHVYLDDTWLHLGMTVSADTYAAHEASATRGRAAHDEEPTCSSGSTTTSGTKVLSKLLNAAQVDDALEAIGRRLDAQRRRLAHELQEEAEAADYGAGDDDPPRRVPFQLRVYLHNQFGKEMLVQRIAQRLGTRAVLDDGRYARIAIVSAALQGGDIDSGEDDIAAAFEVSPSPGPLSLTAVMPSEWRERDFYHLDLQHFMPDSQNQRLLAEIAALEAQQQQQGSSSAAARSDRLDALYEQMPLVAVVGTRGEISPAALDEASRRLGHRRRTPVYGVVMSGWARLQSMRGQAAEVWQVPTTLHCTPQEIIDFVRMLRPRSVTPLHYRASRSPTVIMQRLGPHLHRPFVNAFFAGDATLLAGAAREWLCLVRLPEALTTGPGGDGVDAFGAPLATLGPRQLGFRIAPPPASAYPPEEIPPRRPLTPSSTTATATASIADLAGMLSSQDVNALPPLLSPGELDAMCASYQQDRTGGSQRHDSERPAPLPKRPRAVICLTDDDDDNDVASICDDRLEQGFLYVETVLSDSQDDPVPVAPVEAAATTLACLADMLESM